MSAFSGTALADVLGYPQIDRLVRQKDKNTVDASDLSLLADFLQDMMSDELIHAEGSIDDFKSHFEVTDNAVGLAILKRRTFGSFYHT